MTTPRIHSTPLSAVRNLVVEEVIVGNASFKMEHPGSYDSMLSHPVVRQAFDTDNYLPYWTQIWPASRMLAKAVLHEDWEQLPAAKNGPLQVLEIACGLGLAGIAALKRGLKVIFSDVDELALHFAAINARRAGFTEFTTQALDLRSPPSDLKFHVILCADLLYETYMIEMVINFVKNVLAPGGVCLLTDPDRGSAQSFEETACAAGLCVERKFARAGEPGGERVKGSLYRITKPDSI